MDEWNASWKKWVTDHVDNFTPPKDQRGRKSVDGIYETESSGGITFNTLRDYAASGVDYISVGALTHSVKSLDMSLKAF